MRRWVRLIGPMNGSLAIGDRMLSVGDGLLACPPAIPVRVLAAALFARGIEADDVVEAGPDLSHPCRLIRFDSHGTVFVIAEPLPELVALLKLLRLESAVHKQGYEVERLAGSAEP